MINTTEEPKIIYWLRLLPRRASNTWMWYWHGIDVRSVVRSCESVQNFYYEVDPVDYLVEAEWDFVLPEIIRVAELWIGDQSITVLDALCETALVPSRSQGLRKLGEGAVRVNGTVTKNGKDILMVPGRYLLGMGRSRSAIILREPTVLDTLSRWIR